MHDNLQLLGEALAFFKTDFAGLVFLFRDSSFGLSFGNRQKLNYFLSLSFPLIKIKMHKSDKTIRIAAPAIQAITG